MDGGNGWPSGKYAGGPHDTTIMNRIMLRFRPIAPKPVAGGSSNGSTPEGNNMELVSKRRVKRKYVRVKKNSKCKSCKEDEARSSMYGDNGTVLTLQLMPESSSGVKSSLESTGSRPFWMNNIQKSENNNDVLAVGSDQLDRRVEMQKKRVVESWVMVDRMTNALVDGEALGSTDMEKMKNLEADTCPGMISDGLDRVQWVNLAYRRMVDPLEGSGTSSELVTWLVVKEKIVLPHSPAFACTVRILYTKHSQTMPCDVWKMEFGGFAWRLDDKAALRLGR
ncbi:hypothetical protein P3S67_023131 [Capsicum chacoense]|uniref:uncharacterized protein LOC107858849 n=1 Tax=Capsicum annuum TaxID=4072 RepID=UPI0007BF3656|nr:uncharacterized protein LOC107858849 [Capsicum annuum]KAF3651456.1 putative cytochrome c1-2, heme protein, mitochondrial-like [Capsicum annuum]KAF3668955.1 putative cytochrome c1-2, heme protein, mitochondrial-like [Capsicum annuum]